MEKSEEKIIISKGNAWTPARFWSWAVCTKEEFKNENYSNDGWIESKTTMYLDKEQLEFLQQ